MLSIKDMWSVHQRSQIGPSMRKPLQFIIRKKQANQIDAHPQVRLLPPRSLRFNGRSVVVDCSDNSAKESLLVRNSAWLDYEVHTAQVQNPSDPHGN